MVRSPVSADAHHRSTNSDRRSMLGTTAVAAASISAVAFVALIVGAVLRLKGFQEGESATTLGAIVWFAFVLGALLAIFFGVFAFFVGRSRGLAGEKRAGLVGIGWFVAAVLAVVIISALDS